jgi:hypothetical protein
MELYKKPYNYLFPAAKPPGIAVLDVVSTAIERHERGGVKR